MRGFATVIVGAALGAGIISGAALLLYTGQGFLRAAGSLVGLATAALAAGVWVGGGERAARVVRARWLLLIIAFSLAGAFSLLWLVRTDLRASPFGSAMAVLFILAEPAYFSGSLLMSLSAYGRTTSGAASAIAGGALGILVASTLLIPSMQAPTIFLGAAVVLTFVGALVAIFERAPDALEEPMDLKDHVVLVTGVSHPGQAGYTVAQRLLRAGARVLITARSGNVNEIARELGPADRISGAVADLLDEAAVRALMSAARERYGRLDALINVAGGLSVIKTMENTTSEEWHREIQRNADTAFNVARAALPLLRESRGAIVNFASPAGLRAVKDLGAYSAAKAAVIALSRALALEERTHGVRVNVIAPGMIDTEQNRKNAEDPSKVRWVTREQVADAALFLISNEGKGINGEVVHVMGEGIA
jgi:NAD(P)-dependent dehydrogenase (short-subunit alcohol dehydrogenase family)